MTLARDQNALLTLLTVAPPPATPVGVGANAPPDMLDFHAKLLREATDSIPAETIPVLLMRSPGVKVNKPAAEAATP